MGVPLAEKSHKPIFLKSRDGCPEFENLRNKNIFGLENFSGQKKPEFLFVSFFEKKELYRADWWSVARNKVKKRFSGIAYYIAWEWYDKIGDFGKTPCNVQYRL